MTSERDGRALTSRQALQSLRARLDERAQIARYDLPNVIDADFIVRVAQAIAQRPDFTPGLVGQEDWCLVAQF